MSNQQEVTMRKPPRWRKFFRPLVLNAYALGWHLWMSAVMPHGWAGMLAGLIMISGPLYLGTIFLLEVLDTAGSAAEPSLTASAPPKAPPAALLRARREFIQGEIAFRLKLLVHAADRDVLLGRTRKSTDVLMWRYDGIPLDAEQRRSLEAEVRQTYDAAYDAKLAEYAA